MMYWYKYDLLFDEIFFYRLKKNIIPSPVAGDWKDFGTRVRGVAA